MKSQTFDCLASRAAPWWKGSTAISPHSAAQKHCIGVGSGTDAVRFALMAAGVNKDPIVVTVPNTFVGTTEAITQAGARPDLVDIDERTYNMDPEKLREYFEEQCFLSPT